MEKFGFMDRAVVVRDKAHIFLKKNESVFDIVFLDPPYASEELEMSLSLIGDRNILSEGGIVIAEHSSKKVLSPSVGSLELKKGYKYGDTSLSLYRKISR
ncbi:MAG: RsmD family RNA methyltransferase [Nitrospirae bacterium]|nr:RsmD family RNA methyltransferase [Nitrospirota bacterium]